MIPWHLSHAARLKLGAEVTVDRACRGPGRFVWVVGRDAWFQAGRDADQGWDSVFVPAHDSPEFMTRDQAEAEAMRRNREE